jgi:hypothetical protein
MTMRSRALHTHSSPRAVAPTPSWGRPLLFTSGVPWARGPWARALPLPLPAVRVGSLVRIFGIPFTSSPRGLVASGRGPTLDARTDASPEIIRG